MTLARIQLRRDTAANWTTANTVLGSGEFGFETDTLRFKVGDGATAWTSLAYEVAYIPTGTLGAPTAITAAGGITAHSAPRQYQFIVGSPGAVSVSANPQISAGAFVGQELVLRGTDDTKAVTIANGTGLLLNGPCTLKSASCISLVWDSTNWCEVSRNDL
jgi:hypothetical protein